MLVQWQKDFELGQPTTDAEHREVVDLLNELDVLLATGSPPEPIDRALEALARLLDSHLHAQEGFAPVVGQVRNLHRNWRESATIPNRSDLRALAHWWLQHVCSHPRIH